MKASDAPTPDDDFPAWLPDRPAARAGWAAGKQAPPMSDALKSRISTLLYPQGAPDEQAS